MEQTFTTKSGLTLELQQVGFYDLVDIEMATADPEPPNYETEIAGGAKQSFPHDETTLKTADEWTKWRKYIADKQNCGHRRNYITIGFGVKNVTVPPEWIEKRKTLKGVYFPSDDSSVEWAGFYVAREFVKSPEEVTRLVGAIMKMSEIIPEAALDKALASFPNNEKEEASVATEGGEG